MSRFESSTIREVESSDLETFYEHQLDPEAIRMAAFVGKDPKDKVAFDAHRDRILNSSQNTTRTIVAEGQVAGHIACYPHCLLYTSDAADERSSVDLGGR